MDDNVVEVIRIQKYLITKKDYLKGQDIFFKHLLLAYLQDPLHKEIIADPIGLVDFMFDRASRALRNDFSIAISDAYDKLVDGIEKENPDLYKE